MFILHIFKLNLCHLVFISYSHPMSILTRYVSSVQYPYLSGSYWIDNEGLETDLRES